MRLSYVDCFGDDPTSVDPPDLNGLNMYKNKYGAGSVQACISFGCGFSFAGLQNGYCNIALFPHLFKTFAPFFE